MKTFETKIDNSDITLKITYNEDNDTLKFYKDDVLIEEFKIKELLEHKTTRLISGQIFPAVNKVHKFYNYLLDFMYDGHKDVYNAIKMNDSFIDFLENIRKED